MVEVDARSSLLVRKVLTAPLLPFCSTLGGPMYHQADVLWQKPRLFFVGAILKKVGILNLTFRSNAALSAIGTI
jgi:hypothetical protein